VHLLGARVLRMAVSASPVMASGTGGAARPSGGRCQGLEVAPATVLWLRHAHDLPKQPESTARNHHIEPFHRARQGRTLGYGAGQAEWSPQKGQRTLIPFGRELDDEVLSQEITLLGEVVIAASRVTQHLTQDEVDQILRVQVMGGSDDR